MFSNLLVRRNETFRFPHWFPPTVIHHPLSTARNNLWLVERIRNPSNVILRHSAGTNEPIYDEPFGSKPTIKARLTRGRTPQRREDVMT